MNKKKYRVALTDEERQTLEDLTRKGKSAARIITRARIVLKADSSIGAPACTDEQIRDALDVGLATIYRVRQAFVEGGLSAVIRPVKASREYQRLLDGDLEAHLVALACADPPPGRARWTLRLLAQRFVDLGHIQSIAPETVRQTLKKTS